MCVLFSVGARRSVGVPFWIGLHNLCFMKFLGRFWPETANNWSMLERLVYSGRLLLLVWCSRNEIATKVSHMCREVGICLRFLHRFEYFHLLRGTTDIWESHLILDGLLLIASHWRLPVIHCLLHAWVSIPCLSLWILLYDLLGLPVHKRRCGGFSPMPLGGLIGVALIWG